MIVAFTGRAQNGKDTACDIIQAALGPMGWQRHSFAAPMKTALGSIVKHWTPEFIESHKDEVDPKVGITPRQGLNSMGRWTRETLPMEYEGYAQAMGARIWAERLLDDYTPDQNWFISDLRFLVEHDGIRTHSHKNYLIIGVSRLGFPVEVNPMDSEVPALPKDVIIDNDRGRMAFQDKIKYLSEFLVNLDTHYIDNHPTNGRVLIRNQLRHWMAKYD